MKDSNAGDYTTRIKLVSRSNYMGSLRSAGDAIRNGLVRLRAVQELSAMAAGFLLCIAWYYTILAGK